MKIAFIYDTAYPWVTGGAENRIFEIGKRLRLRGHDIHVFSLGYWMETKEYYGQETIKYNDITYHSVGKPMELYTKDGSRSIKEALYFAKCLVSVNFDDFDIVDCQGFPYFSCYTSKLKTMNSKANLVITLHEVWNDYWYDYMGRKGFFGKIVEKGIDVGVVIGGGNYWRGRSNDNIDRTKADQIGMLATIMNCIYVSEIFRSCGIKTNILTPFECGSMTKLFSKDRANKYFEKGMVVFFAGGTGHPYFSTDTGIVLRAIELDADAILLAKAIDGVYDSDPKINPAAKKYDTLPIQEVVDKKLGVIDMTASVMCMENKMPLMIFGLNEKDSILNAMTGKFNGTVVTVD